MKRYIRILASVALAAAAIGCGGTTPAKLDMRVSPDLTPAAIPDLMPPGGGTGAACTKSSDCAGNGAMCLTKVASGQTFPGGYCTSKCSMARNDPDTGLNPACPGKGSCDGGGNCVAACTGASDPNNDMPCRDGYACFVDGCLPISYSQCDPAKQGSCKSFDGGAPRNNPDGGPDGGYIDICVPIGSDPVGGCFAGCSVFRQDCGDTSGGTPRGCYATFMFGEGLCSTFQGGADGEKCMYLNTCNAGLGCHTEGGAGVCRFYCGGPGNKACPAGQTCTDLSPTVKKAVVGVCGK